MFFTLIASSIASVSALAPTPVGGTATVDGNISERGIADITNPTVDDDYFAPLYKAHKDTNLPPLGYVFLRYDGERMYVLVIASQAEGLNLVIDQTSTAHWVKVPDNKKVAAVDVGAPSEFEWISEGGKVIGYEASFELTYPVETTMAVHLQLVPSDTAGTSGTAGVANNSIPLVIPSEFVVPEYALGGLVAIGACFAAFAAYKKRATKIGTTI